jgi:hypothetical protein
MSCLSGLKKTPLQKLCDAVLLDDCPRARRLIDDKVISADPADRPGAPGSAATAGVPEDEEARRRRALEVRKRNDGHVDGVLFMRELPDDTSGNGGGFFTPLHLAAYVGSPEMCHLLLERGVDVNCRTQRWRFVSTSPWSGWGWFTPLHIAALRGHTSVVCKLLQREATQGFRTQRGLTAVQLAGEEVKVLLQNVADARRRAAEMDDQLKLEPEGPNAVPPSGSETPRPQMVEEADPDKGKNTPAKAEQDKDGDGDDGDDSGKGKGKGKARADKAK